jgi:hypothetical protein
MRHMALQTILRNIFGFPQCRRILRKYLDTYRGGLAPQNLVGFFFTGPPKKKLLTLQKKKKKVIK